MCYQVFRFSRLTRIVNETIFSNRNYMVIADQETCNETETLVCLKNAMQFKSEKIVQIPINVL